MGIAETAALIALWLTARQTAARSPLGPCKCRSKGGQADRCPDPPVHLLSHRALSYPCAPAGVMGAKQTAALIPLCHNIFLSKVDVRATLQQESCSLLITAEASTTSETGTGHSPWCSQGAPCACGPRGDFADTSQQLQPSSTHTAMVPGMAYETGACSVPVYDCSCG